VSVRAARELYRVALSADRRSIDARETASLRSA
jgi:hypothetical protein